MIKAKGPVHLKERFIPISFVGIDGIEYTYARDKGRFGKAVYYLCWQEPSAIMDTDTNGNGYPVYNAHVRQIINNDNGHEEGPVELVAEC